MKHPYQNIRTTRNHIIVTVKHHIQVFLLLGDLVGNWSDNVETEQNSKDSNNQTTNQKQEEEKSLSNYIRNIELFGNYVVAITDSNKSIIVFEIVDLPNCLQIVKRQPFPKRPCSISMADHGETIIVADKFGDVYKISLKGEPVPEKSLSPILGHVSMLTNVMITEIDGKQFLLTSDRDEHLKVSHYPQTYVVSHWLFGHDQFISTFEVLEFNKQLIISGGGDDFIYLWNWYTNQQLSSLNIWQWVESYLTEFHLPPSRFLTETSKKELTVIKIVSIDRRVVIAFENVKLLLVVLINDDLQLEFDQLVECDAVIDISCNGKTFYGAVDSPNYIQEFDVHNNFRVIDNDFQKIINLNPCLVKQRADFYPLYTVNSLRKRSEY